MREDDVVRIFEEVAVMLLAGPQPLFSTPALAIALGDLAYAIFISILGIFLLVGRVIFPSVGRGAPQEILRLRRPAGALALCFGLFEFLEARRLIPEVVGDAVGCAFVAAMAWIIVAFWKFLRKRRAGKNTTPAGAQR